MIKEYGVGLAGALRARLADIAAADNLAELIVGNVRPDPENANTYTIDLEALGRLRVCANDSKSRNKPAASPERVNDFGTTGFTSLESKRRC